MLNLHLITHFITLDNVVLPGTLLNMNQLNTLEVCLLWLLIHSGFQQQYMYVYPDLHDHELTDA